MLCQGKIYYELLEERRKRRQHEVAIARVEAFYPFPEALLRAVIEQYPSDTEIVWCQEEPRNMGVWPMYDEWLLGLLGASRAPGYVGRPAAASPAPGSTKVHARNQLRVIDEALSIS